MSEAFRDEAIILRSVPFEDDHLIIKALTKEHGKLSLFARSARKSRKRFGGLLDPGQCVLAHMKQTRGQALGERILPLDKLDPVDSFFGLRESSRKLNDVFFALSIMDDSVPEGPSETALYSNLKFYLITLSQSKSKAQFSWLKLLFWANLSRLMGFGGAPESIKSTLMRLKKQLESKGIELKALDYSFINNGALSLEPVKNEDLEKMARHWAEMTGSMRIEKTISY